jgi:hypothetical protein
MGVNRQRKERIFSKYLLLIAAVCENFDLVWT